MFTAFTVLNVLYVKIALLKTNYRKSYLQCTEEGCERQLKYTENKGTGFLRRKINNLLIN